MKPEVIKSRENALLKRARAVRDGKNPELIFVEGMRLCEEAINSALPIEAAIVSDELARKSKIQELVRRLENGPFRLALISESLLASISYTKTPQGIIVLAARPKIDEATFKSLQPKSPLLVVMHGINNPVNVGAILRTAEAAGASGVITTMTTSDPFSAKGLRGAMGSAFRLPIWTGAAYEDVIEWCRENDIETVCADVAGSVSYPEVNWTGAKALIVGPESTGLSQMEIEEANLVVRIPMQGKVESLNVGVAAAILLYEAVRQRNSLPSRRMSS